MAEGSPFIRAHRSQMIDTGEPKDHYLSTLGKGLLGLKLMHARFASLPPPVTQKKKKTGGRGRGDDGGGDGRRLTPTRPKWYAILGDDLHLQAANLAGLLSAFDPDEDWAITQAGVSAKHGFRSFGGAGIVTSRALTARLAP